MRTASLASLYRGCLVALVLLLASTTTACRSAQTPTAIATSTSIDMPTPAIGAAPTDCPLTPAAPQARFTQLAPVISAAPVWATWPAGPVVAHLVPPPGSRFPTSYEAPYGWPVTKVVWEVGPDYTDTVTVRGQNRSPGAPPPLLRFLDATPASEAELDPQHPDHAASVVGDKWAEWGSEVIVPQAGCYSLQVSWPSGHWEVTFAAGA